MRQSRWSLLLAAALVVVFAGTTLATPGSGLTATDPVRGTASESVHFNTGEVKFQTKAPVDLVYRTLTFGVSSTSGWHSHPGIVLVTVTAGSLVRYHADCSSEVIPTGGAFVESGDDAGLVRNESPTIVAVTNTTWIVPAGTTDAGLRINKDNPGCTGLN
jgi:quercetin dioxygenase-like cupin family protein